MLTILGAIHCYIRHRRRYWQPMQVTNSLTNYKCQRCGRWW